MVSSVSELSGWVEFIPKKTNTKRYKIIVKQPLHPDAKELFNEVDFNTGKTYDISHQKYNPKIIEVLKALKNIYPDAGFTSDYTSHNMRDTFISICVKRNVNLKTVMVWAGLRKFETLEHYIDLDDDFIEAEMKKTIIKQ